MKAIIDIIATLWHLIYPYSLSLKFQRLRQYFFSSWIKHEFNSIEKVSFGRGLSLIGAHNISIGNKTAFGINGTLQAHDSYLGVKYNPSIIIGCNCWIGDYFNISAIDSITIGDNLVAGRWVTILDNTHGATDIESLRIPPADRKLASHGAISIGNNVLIGDKVTILSGVSIGDNVVIGSNAVVTKDIPPYSIIGGIPAKIISHGI